MGIGSLQVSQSCSVTDVPHHRPRSVASPNCTSGARRRDSKTGGVALDFSPLMLEQARGRLARFSGRAAVVEADLGTPAWLDAVRGPFDAVVSGFAIHHLPDERKRTLYREVHGLLSEGGVFLNCEHV